LKTYLYFIDRIQYTFIIIILLSIFIQCTNNPHFNENKSTEQKDSINLLIENTKTKSLSLQEKKIKLLTAYKLSKIQTNDSIRKKYLLKIAFQAYKLNDSTFFKLTNKEACNLSIKLRDTLNIARTYWNYGLFYSKNGNLEASFDHYYKAYNYYELINHIEYSGKMLYNMAFIQGRLKAFTDSETNAFNAISKFKLSKNNLLLYRCYNLLGNIYKELGKYKTATTYHKKALTHLQELENKKTYQEGVYNNIALSHLKQGDYKVAKSYFLRALNTDSLDSKNPKLYAKIKDNLAYTRLLSGDTLGVKEDLIQSLKIRDSLQFIDGIIINKIHLAEYYLKIKDTSKALYSIKEANTLATLNSNNRDILASLSLLSTIDTKNADNYFIKFQKLTNELQLKERNLRNKFARIRFETDEYIEEADKQSSEKLMVATISTTIIIILLLLYFLRHQRGKNRELALEGEQQRANENIYSLLLQQQAKLEEGRLNERHRISQELHDGLLGKIFATRMRLDFLDIEGNAVIQEKFQLYLGELQEIEKEMRVISHELKNELLSSKADYTQIITHLIAEQSNIANFKYKIEIEDTVHWSLISDIIKINCYRVTQEALQNIIKYAKATKVSVSFSFKDNTLVLNIQDNGVGFDSSKNNKGIGLQNITARIKKLKGTFVIISSLEQGALLTIRIPVTELKADVKSISK